MFAIFHFNIITQNMSKFSFHCSFLHQTPHTIHHLCMSQFPPHFLLLSHCFDTIKQKYYCTISYTEGDEVTVQLNNSGAELC